jgi:hypothetical protein
VVTLPRRLLLLVAATLMALLLMVMAQVMAAPSAQDGVWKVRVADAQGSIPIIGGAPPGEVQRNLAADNNPGTDDRTRPRTGGQRFECHGQQGGQVC